MNKEHKSGFVALIGRPNVGKSTFMNHAIGKKVAIMSDKVQTTRNRIHGVYHSDDSQIIFVDTPGIHKPKHSLGKVLTQTALSTFDSVDLILFLVVADEEPLKGEQFIIEHLKNTKTPVCLVINKIDLIKQKEKLLERISEYTSLMKFKEVIPISALKGENTDSVIKVVKEYLPEGPKYYPEGQISDYPETFIMSEIVREKILQLTKEEVPHSVAVYIESLEKDGDRIHVTAVIVVERNSQKGIIIGKNGQMIKQIGEKSRTEINKLLGTKIYLETFVKVMKDWRNKQSSLQKLGLNETL